MWTRFLDPSTRYTCTIPQLSTQYLTTVSVLFSLSPSGLGKGVCSSTLRGLCYAKEITLSKKGHPLITTESFIPTPHPNQAAGLKLDDNDAKPHVQRFRHGLSLDTLELLCNRTSEASWMPLMPKAQGKIDRPES
jgi:hypothetical protein